MNVAVIPARGGSRRIPRKNIRLFHGKPILAYSIEAAIGSGLFDEVAVSTDDAEIGEVAVSCGAYFLRREPWCGRDEVGTQEVMQQALFVLEDAKLDGMKFLPPYSYACCIYATAPMLTREDLWRGYNLMRETNQYAFVPGWFYWGRAEWFGERPLPKEQAFEVEPERYIDINTEDEWSRAEQMFARTR